MVSRDTTRPPLRMRSQRRSNSFFVRCTALPSRHTVEREGSAVHLTKKEFDLLWLLIRSGGRVVSRETILSRLWDYAADIETRTVDVHIRSLRKKVGEDVIETVVGVGYKFAR